MDMGNLQLFIKMVREDYALTDEQLELLRHRMLSDVREFVKV